MKLYHFNPNDYGEEAYVVAPDKAAAINVLLVSKPNLETVQNEVDREWHIQYHARKVAKMVTCSEGYTIDEHEPGTVIFSEVA